MDANYICLGCLTRRPFQRDNPMTEITRQQMVEWLDLLILREINAGASCEIPQAIRAALTEQQAQALPEGKPPGKWAVCSIKVKLFKRVPGNYVYANGEALSYLLAMQAAIEAARREGV